MTFIYLYHFSKPSHYVADYIFCGFALTLILSVGVGLKLIGEDK